MEDNQFLDAIKRIALNSNRSRARNRSRTQKLSEHQYTGPSVTTQDKISKDAKKIKEKLKDFEKIERDDYSFIAPGTFIRYLKKLPNNRIKYCHGGILIINASPSYWILKNRLPDGTPTTWSVQLQTDNIYYCKKHDDVPQKSLQEVCEMVLSGEYRLVKASLLSKMNPDVLVKLVGREDEQQDSDEDNSDEDSSTLESDEDSDEYRRPTTIVTLV